jgi:deferrochelatase/peroxidase EfeB
VYPFFGAHQSGIVTPAQDRLHFASFDVGDITRDELVELLQDWSAASALMTAGDPVGVYGAVSGPYDAPPDDTGEALGLPAAGLTITIGFGPTLFTSADGTDRFGIAGRRPAALADLPHFPADALVETLTGGDLCIQACSDDPQVAVHAIRNLSRIAFGRASIRWSQLGFGRTSSTTTAQLTPRNLFGFKDGTANIKAEETAVVDEQVWAGADDAAWMAGGSYLVARKIRMTIETWDRTSLREQEAIVGRTKGEGAPFSGGTEFSEPDFAATGRGGVPLIATDAHVRLAHPDQNAGAKMLRRGYNFVDGNDDLGRLNDGLFFICYQRDPRTQFVPIQMNLAKNDAMNEYLRHVGSGVFAVPPGASEGGFVGETLFA